MARRRTTSADDQRYTCPGCGADITDAQVHECEESDLAEEETEEVEEGEFSPPGEEDAEEEGEPPVEANHRHNFTMGSNECYCGAERPEHQHVPGVRGNCQLCGKVLIVQVQQAKQPQEPTPIRRTQPQTLSPSANGERPESPPATQPTPPAPQRTPAPPAPVRARGGAAVKCAADPECMKYFESEAALQAHVIRAHTETLALEEGEVRPATPVAITVAPKRATPPVPVRQVKAAAPTRSGIEVALEAVGVAATALETAIEGIATDVEKLGTLLR